MYNMYENMYPLMVTGVRNPESATGVRGFYWYSLSNVILVDEKLSSFHQYLRYCHKSVTFVFSIPGAIYESNLTLLAWFLPDCPYLSMLSILRLFCTAAVQTISRINFMLK